MTPKNWWLRNLEGTPKKTLSFDSQGACDRLLAIYTKYPYKWVSNFFLFQCGKKEISRFSKFSSMGFSIWYANILVWTLRSIVWSLTVNSMKSSLLFRSKIKQKKKFSVKIILKIKLLGIPNLLFIKAVQKRGLQIRTGTNIKIHSQKTLWRRRNPNGKARDPDRYKRWPTVLTVKPENQTGIKGYKPSK